MSDIYTMQRILKQLFCGFLILTLILESHSVLPYNYGMPNEWCDAFKQCCGSKQSPINLELPEETDDKIPCIFKFEGYEQTPKGMDISNQGNTVEIHATWSKKAPYVFLKEKESKYIFMKIHFHWGEDDTKGSDHTLGNKRFPLEMHMLHYNEKYGSMDEAKSEDDGLLVIGKFFEIQERGQDCLPFSKNLLSIKEPNNKKQVKITPFPLSMFNFEEGTGHVIYSGSLTTPPCAENVFWILSTSIFPVKKTEMQKFRAIILDNEVKSNFRPLQELNGREITAFPHWT